MRPNTDALRRALQEWGDVALDTRRKCRAQGLPVSRWLDDQAGQARGGAVVAGLVRMAEELADAGLTTDEIARAMSAATLAIVLAALSEPKQAA
jgi:hypothetical protein